MKIALGNDHRGYRLKEMLKAHLGRVRHEVRDFGCDSEASTDYPDFAIPVAESVAAGEVDLGIVICGTGIGMCIAANKVKGVRAALCHDELTALTSRRHNDANVLCLASDLIGEELARHVVDAWLKSDFESGRHERRVGKIIEYESNHSA